MSLNNEVIVPPHHSCPVVQKHELLEHLGNFQRDVNRYMHSLPAIVLDVPSSSLISSAMALNWNIECFKNTLADAIIKEGLDGRQDFTLSNAPVQQNHPPNSINRLIDMSQRFPMGSVPPLMPVPSSTAQFFNPAAMKGPVYRSPQRSSTRGRGQIRASRTVDRTTTFSGTYSQQYEKESAIISQPINQNPDSSIPGLFNPVFST